MVDLEQTGQLIEKGLTPPQAEQLVQYRFLSSVLVNVNQELAQAPTDYRIRWEAVRERQADELSQFVESAVELQDLFLGVLDLAKIGGSDQLEAFRRSFDVLREFEGDAEWIAGEETRIVRMGQVALVGNELAQEAHSYREQFLKESEKEVDPDVNVSFDEEGIIIFGDFKPWDLFASTTGNPNRWSPKEESSRCYHVLKIYVELSKKYGDKIQFGFVTSSIREQQELVDVFLPNPSGDKNKDNTKIRSRIETATRKINYIFKSAGEEDIIQQSSKQYSYPVTNCLNPKYRVAQALKNPKAQLKMI